MNNNERIHHLKEAFKSDNFIVKDVKEYEGKIGIMAEYQDKHSYSGKTKRAYYVEGSSYQMGYLMGILAEKEISKTATEFLEKCVSDKMIKDCIWQFLLKHFPQFANYLVDQYVDLIFKWTEKTMNSGDIPEEFHQEIDGLYQGCIDAAKAEGRKVNFEKKDLWVLNCGNDSRVANLAVEEAGKENALHPLFMDIVGACSCFSIRPGENVKIKDNKHYFGRDFTGRGFEIFAEVACVVIYNPDPVNGKRRLPLVSQTAPGMIGSPTVMNSEGVAMAVLFFPSTLCSNGSTESLGLNSLFLLRHCIQDCDSAKAVADQVIHTKRGVPWLYPVADKDGHACIIEAGKTLGDHEKFPYFDNIPKEYIPGLPNEDFLEKMRTIYGTPAPQKGAVVRWDNYNYPRPFIEDNEKYHFNRDLWRIYHKDSAWMEKLENIKDRVWGPLKKLLPGIDINDLFGSIWTRLKESFKKPAYDPGFFGHTDFINKSWDDRNCPGPFYFTPQREIYPEVVLGHDLAVSPEMRLTGMSDHLNMIYFSLINEAQWHYDVLNYHIQDEIEKTRNREGIDEHIAWRLIEYLSPDPETGFYLKYNNPDDKDWKKIVIPGSITLLELKERKMITHFGCFGDEPIAVHLLKYISHRA